MRALGFLLFGFIGALPNIAGAAEMEEALGGYVTVYVDNFDRSEFAAGITSRDVCLPKASEIAIQFQKEGAEVETIFRNQFFALYKVRTKTDQKLFIHCNQNGSLIIGWKADGDVGAFMETARGIGITLQEKAIDSQAQPASTTNNINVNQQ